MQSYLNQFLHTFSVYSLNLIYTMEMVPGIMAMFLLTVLDIHSSFTCVNALYIRNARASDELQAQHAKHLIAEIRKTWDMWDRKDKVQGDNMLQFDSFYNGFMTPYFSSYGYTETKQALKIIETDVDDYVDWSEFTWYLKWAVQQYPNTATSKELLDVAFNKGIIPVMRDETIAK